MTIRQRKMIATVRERPLAAVRSFFIRHHQDKAGRLEDLFLDDLSFDDHSLGKFISLPLSNFLY